MDPVTYVKVAAWCTGTSMALFAGTHQVAKEAFNHRLTVILKSVDLAQWLKEWPKGYGEFFDGVFGRKHLSWKCFYRSCIASLVGITITTLAFFSIGDISVSQYLASWSGISASALAFALTIDIVGNLIPDYLSLLETRYAIKWLEKPKHVFVVVAVLLVDLAVTFTLFVLYLGISNTLYFAYTGTAVHAGLIDRILHYFAFYPEWIANPHINLNLTETLEHAIQMCTTFFTSAWLWLFAGGTIVIKILALCLGPTWLWVRDHLLNVDEKPILALGWVASSLVLVGFLAMAPFVVTMGSG